MSFKGSVEAECPGCSETEQAEIWSFVRGDQDEALRNRVKAGDINLVECPHCGRMFHPEAAFVYADPGAGLLAFVFPESYSEDEATWRAKMRTDYEQMKPVAEQMGLPEEPLIFFGADALAALIQHLDELEDESDVAGYLCKELGLLMRRVQAGFARERDLPRSLPYAPVRGEYSREGAVSALKTLVAQNDRLAGYRRWLEHFERGGEEPPFTQSRPPEKDAS